ncbi:MAG: hypothetical protein LBH10_01140, partial [Burkholderiaceae bacterium]|nr:hypothetical protein [Burkholderiaceae bacterium]
MTITQLPEPPQPTDSPSAFNEKAFGLLGALPRFVDETNALCIDAQNAANVSIIHSQEAAGQVGAAAAQVQLAAQQVAEAAAHKDAAGQFSAWSHDAQQAAEAARDAARLALNAQPWQPWAQYNPDQL